MRTELLKNWLDSLFPTENITLSVASSDASFRRYFRATWPDGHSKIVMDAPPEHEDCTPFVAIDRCLEAAGVPVPHIHAENLPDGFLLLSDLGNTTLLQVLEQNSQARLYDQATSALVTIQQADAQGLPPYDHALLHRELMLFPDWYVSQHLQTRLSDAQTASLHSVFEAILANNLAQPQVFVHRDYHSRNLMVTDTGLSVIDFQDAVKGPITYDLVSLMKDAYIAWDEEIVLDHCVRYWEKARQAGLPIHADFADFYQDFEWMGVQRHIKVLGIFARLCHRDGKTAYVNDMPMVMNYLRKTCVRYAALHPLLNLLDALEGTTTEAAYTF